MKSSLDAAREKLKDVSWLSLDVFDTAILRRLRVPTDLFGVMHDKAAAIVGPTLADFHLLRTSAEREVRIISSRQPGGNAEISLNDIYDYIQAKLGLTPDQAQHLLDLELRMEMRFAYANPCVLLLYNEARRLNKKTFFLSDMYLSSAHIRDLLIASGYEDPLVFVSSEYGCSKHSGKLYRRVSRELNIAPGDVIHIGDNFRSDFVQARRNGWAAFHYPLLENALPAFKVSPSAPSSTNSIMHGLIAEYERMNKQSGAVDQDVWRWIGYTVAGPVFFSFACWLAAVAREAGIRRIHLCSRDGFSLVESLKILQETWSLDMDPRYLFASRKIYQLANIRILNREAVKFLLMITPGLTLRDFVERCNAVPSEQEKSLKELGFDSLDMPLTEKAFGRFIHPVYQERLETWLRQIDESLLAGYQKERETALDYLEQEQIHHPDSLIVDVGWRGTIIRSIQGILEEKYPKLALKSCFFGTHRSADCVVRPTGGLRSYFFHLDIPKRRRALVDECVELVELLFCAPHPTVVGLRKGPESIEPVYGKLEHSEEEMGHLTLMRESAYQFVGRAAELTGGLPSVAATEAMTYFVEERLSRMLYHPTITEATALGSFGHWHGYGDKGTLRKLAFLPQPIQGKRSLSSLSEAYGEAFWKRGFLVQLPQAQTRLVRCLHFVNSVRVAVKSGTFWKSLRWVLFRMD